MTRNEFFKVIATAVAASTGQAPAEVIDAEVKPGSLYVIEIDDTLRDDEMDSIGRALEPFEKRFDCKFMVLHSGMKFSNPNAPVININMNSLPTERPKDQPERVISTTWNEDGTYSEHVSVIGAFEELRERGLFPPEI